MTTPMLSACQVRRCVHFWGPLFGPMEDAVICCAAFPKGIPSNILAGDNPHTVTVDGDGGIIFEPVAAEEE